MIKTPAYRANTLAYIYRIQDRHTTQEVINNRLQPIADAPTMSNLKLTVWEYVLTAYSNEFTLRKSTAFSEWFAAQWHSHNLEIVRHILPVLNELSLDNYGLYQRMKFSKIYPNDAVITSARKEYFDSVEMKVKA
jgi:hypothetical protein